MMQLCDLQRGVQHKVMDQVGELAQPAAGFLPESAVRNGKPRQIAPTGGAAADEMPERKGFAGPNHQMIERADGKPQILGFVALQAHVNSVEPAQNGRGVPFDKNGKFPLIAPPGKPCPVKKVVQVAAQAFLFHRDAVTDRTVFAKKLPSSHCVCFLSLIFHKNITFRPE